MRRWILPVLLCLPTVAYAQGGNSNPRYNSIGLGPSTGQSAAETGIIRVANNGGLKTTTTSGNCVKLYARDIDGASWTTMLSMCAANTPTIDLAGNVTIGGETILAWTDNASDQIPYFRTSDNTFQPVAYGGTCSFSSGTLTCTDPIARAASLIGAAAGLGALGVVTVPHLVRRRRRRMVEAWA